MVHLKYIGGFGGHYEVWLDKQFICSADTFTEAWNEIDALQRN